MNAETTVKKTKVDLFELVSQGTEEMKSGFDEAGLEVVIEASEERYYVDADSQLMESIVEDLLNNARENSQPGTRVSIEIKPKDTKGCGSCCGAGGLRMTSLEIKYTARDAEEAEQDLATVKDLAFLQDGRLELVKDGDLVTAGVTVYTY